MPRPLRVFLCHASQANLIAVLVLVVFLGACKTQTVALTVIPTATQLIIPTQTPSIGSTMISDKDGMTLLYVPAGKFIMGEKSEEALAICQNFRSDCQLNQFIGEEPPHEVNLNAFWIDQTEVTKAMYTKCVDASICQPPLYTHSYYSRAELDNNPVGFVDWAMANTYCQWAGRRLPTDAEWEKAASWDDRTKTKRIYPWGDNIDCSFANYYGKIGGCVEGTTPVGSYEIGKSPYGAYDMAGNAWEWVNDWFSTKYYRDSPLFNPLGPDTGQYRVVRGGSSDHEGFNVRTTDRYWSVPSTFGYNLGFRCASSP
ncbi:MAG: SUMF1/EgtB/PvdO family nonheme iron enzyme [Anaerolineales bacterium]|nr:SUMF1/EgtB/PvdO family nonheme iron enzyme [Anaerolineales bacterium]